MVIGTRPSSRVYDVWSTQEVGFASNPRDVAENDTTTGNRERTSSVELPWGTRESLLHKTADLVQPIFTAQSHLITYIIPTDNVATEEVLGLWHRHDVAMDFREWWIERWRMSDVRHKIYTHLYGDLWSLKILISCSTSEQIQHVKILCFDSVWTPMKPKLAGQNFRRRFSIISMA